MKRTTIGHGVYRDERGVFWVRPWVAGKRTWRTLKAITQRHAIREAAAKFTDHARAEVGQARSPFLPSADTFTNLADAYLKDRCPNKRLEPRPDPFCKGEQSRIDMLKGFFGRVEARAIHISQLHAYREWRQKKRQKKFFTSDRLIDYEIVTLSNVLTYGVNMKRLDLNPIRSGRPRFRRDADVARSRERALASGDDLHRLADFFFGSPKSEVMGWLLIFSALTGCRQAELLQFRRDTRSTADPGHIEGNHLFLRRAKRGLHPFIEIGADLQPALKAFAFWHDTRFRGSTPWWFPGRDKAQLRKDSFRHALYRACAALAIPRCSPHGLRAFYVTKRRSDGEPDTRIAAEIGDRTVSLISQTYGDVPPNWFGQKKLSFRPAEGLPAWDRWQPAEEKIVRL